MKITLEELKYSFEELKLYKQGKSQLKNARVAMQEIERELVSEQEEEYEAFLVDLAHEESEKGGGKMVSKSELLHLFD